MTDEGNEGRRRGRRRMDLNLYLGLPRSPRARTLDLGSDLALSSLPVTAMPVPTDETTEVPTNPYFLHHQYHVPPYSPTDVTFSPGPILSPTPLPPPEHNPNQANTTYFPSPMIPVPGFVQVSSPDYQMPIEIDEPDSPPHVTATATTTTTGPSYLPHSPYYFPPRSWSYIPLDSEEPDESVSVRPTYRQTLLDRSPRSTYAPTSPLNLSPTYAPPYSPPSPSYLRRSPTVEWLGREDESSSRWHRLQSPEFRFRRLIESSNRLRVRRFRSALPYPHSDRLGFGRVSSPGPEQLMLDIMSSQGSLGRNGKHKVPAESVTTDSSEEGKEESNKSAGNFECNICLDMADNPVVTSCGHLFCWSCLYQWLHIHSDHKECPVCKGEVTESNITPIYGRGGSRVSNGKNLAENGELGLKIPPRPCGIRLESLHQQFQPISRRFTEGIATSWRHPMSLQIRNRNRFEARGDPNGGLTEEQIARMNRVRARVLNPENGPEVEMIRMPRESTPVPQTIIPGMLTVTGGQIGFWRRARAGVTAEEMLNAESDPEAMSRESTALPLSSTTVPLFHDGTNVRRRISIYDFTTEDGVTPITADMGRAVGSGNRYEASTSSLDPWRNERWSSWANVASASAADQASASSTAAMIRGDVGHPDGSVEPNSTGFL